MKPALVVAVVVVLAGGLWLALSVGRRGGTVASPDAVPAPRSPAAGSPVPGASAPAVARGPASRHARRAPGSPSPTDRPGPAGAADRAAIRAAAKAATAEAPIIPRRQSKAEEERLWQERSELMRSHVEARQQRERLLEEATRRLDLTEEERQQVARTFNGLAAQRFRIDLGMSDGTITRADGQVRLDRAEQQAEEELQEALGAERAQKLQELREDQGQ